MRIAALDDEARQLELIRHAMDSDRTRMPWLRRWASSLLRDLHQQSFDLLILDWAFPTLKGPDVVQVDPRGPHSRLPILFVTNRREEEDMVEGLTLGADDFMVKPIRVAELQARVQALLRRTYPALHETELVFGAYRFIPSHAEPADPRQARPSSSTANTSWRCSCSGTSAACCRASTCAKPSGARMRRSPRARSTRTSRACARSWTCGPPTGSSCRPSMASATGSSSSTRTASSRPTRWRARRNEPAAMIELA